jgi:hypothetical protein
MQHYYIIVFTCLDFPLLEDSQLDWRWYSSIPDVQSFRGAGCDTDCSLVVVKANKGLSVVRDGGRCSDYGLLGCDTV